MDNSSRVADVRVSCRQWLTIASADAVILSASNFGVTAAEARDCSPGSTGFFRKRVVFMGCMVLIYMFYIRWLELHNC